MKIFRASKQNQTNVRLSFMPHFEFRTAARLSSVLLSTALVMSFAGCSRTTGEAALAKQQAENEAAIRRLDSAWVKAAATKDPDAWVAFYADNATVLPPNEKTLTDKAAIRKSIGEFLSLPNLQLSWEPTRVEVAKSGDLAYLYGAYSMTMTDERGKPVTDFGKNVEIWKRQSDGSWRCIVDTWNSDIPADPPV
jgi:uncharacterized protein (TIGR02246 family)